MVHSAHGISGFMHLACGLSVGLTGLAAGYAIGVVGDMVAFSLLGRDHEQNTNQLSGRPIIHAAVEDLRWNGPHLDFRGSVGPLRVCQAKDRFASAWIILTDL